MDDTTKSIIKAVAVASLEKIGMAVGTALVAKGLLDPGQLGAFDQIFVGFIIGVASVAWSWYRANGAVLVQDELKRLVAQAQLKQLEMQRQLEAAMTAANWKVQVTPPTEIKRGTGDDKDQLCHPSTQ